MKEKYMISEKSQRIITFLGYWWVVFSVLFGIIQLTQWSFDYRITIWWVGLILFVVVLLISTGVALLLLFLFPHILDRVFKKLPDEEKYYNITPEDESTALKAIIYSSLSNNENDEMLVLPIKLMINKSTSSNKRSETINEYLLKYKLKDVKIYGYDKTQVQQTVNILKKTLKINTDSCFYTDELKPIDMGILRQKKESDKSLTQYLAVLEEWREQNVSADELSMLLKAESYGEYWKRAEKFLSCVADNECTIVVCTTSVAILLTHYLIDPTFMPSQYAHIDIPLGGIIHFVETVNEGKFEITNKESKLNINYKKL